MLISRTGGVGKPTSSRIEIMRNHPLAASFLLTVFVAGCGAFQGEQAVRMDPGGPDLSSRWNANLTTPRRLSGAVNITGTAWMAPERDGGVTEVAIQVENAAPGGVHPWQVHLGRCGANQGPVGSEDAYQPLEVDDQGRASGTATLDFAPNDDRSYFVAIYASPTNRDLTIACGNLASPSS